MLLDAGADRFHHLEVDADEIVTAHAGLARHARGHDHHVRPGDRGIVAGARILGIEAVDGSGFGDVERLALRHAVDDVEQHHVTEFLEAGEMGQRAADLSGADERDLAACHG
ncbi:hypothetical protein M2437_005066 [Methylorubrum pseudosasae]|nr:hypothetical protein [Methylorubrum pseudosasae]